MSRRRTRSNLPIVLMLVALVMIGYGSYLSFVVAEPYSIGDISNTPIDDENTTTTETTTVIVTTTVPVEILPTYTVPEETSTGIVPTREEPFVVGNIFGEDGVFDFGNMILFIGMGLFVVAFLIGRR